MDILAIPFGFIMRLGYELLNSYGLSILFFTVVIKILMFPLNIWTQKNSIKLVKIKPQLNEIEINNFGDHTKIAAKQSEVFKREKYNAFVRLIPLLLQIPIILGLIAVIYNPMQHILQIPEPVITAIEERAEMIAPLTSQLQVVAMIKDPATAASFDTIVVSGYDTATALTSVRAMDLKFCGLDLSTVPPIDFTNILMLIPLLALISTFLLSWVQNLLNVLQREAGWFGRWGMTIFICLFVLYFTFAVPAAIGMYWTFGNLLSVLITVILYLWFNPNKVIDYKALEQTKAMLAKLKAEQKKNRPTAEQKARAKIDNDRFLDDKVHKKLVFFSEKNGFYKYFKGYIDYILENSDLDIHYVTSDPNDAIFSADNPRIITYYIDDAHLLMLFLKAEADMIAMTMSDLEVYHLKRSRMKKDIEYVYMYHGMTNSLMVGRKNCLMHYDTIFCVGPHQVAEFLEEEQIYEFKPRNLQKVGYPYIDELMKSYKASNKTKKERRQILIAPSWQDDNIMDSCIDDCLSSLKDKAIDIIVRPHPEYMKRFGAKMLEFKNKYSEYPNIKLEDDFTSNNSIFESDILITDWSTIAYDFAYSTKKPCIFINTPMKVMNPEYEKFSCENLDILLRNEVGVGVDTDKLDTLGDVVSDILTKSDEFSERITAVVEKYLYNQGNSAKVGGEYIINRLCGNDENDS